MALPTVTPRDLITLALKDAGVVAMDGQTASAGWMNDGLSRINMMVMQWQVKRWLIYRINSHGVVSTGAVSYTVGPAADIPLAVRPERLEAAFFRQLSPAAPNQVDYPLRLIQSREEYNDLAMKQLGSFSNSLFYDNDFPLGVIYPWPVPQANLYSIFITTKDIMGRWENLSDTLVIPEEYYNALRFNLAVELRNAADLPPQPVMVQLAKVSLNTLRGANAQIPVLTMPEQLPGSGGRYNVFSDQGR